MTSSQTILDTDGLVTLNPIAIPPTEADRLFTQLHSDTPWQQDQTELYGKIIPIPRLTAWYSEAGSYSYSGITMTPHPWTTTLAAIQQQVETAAQTTFNSVLLNLYNDGNHSVFWHSDDEPELGCNPTIASLSLGGTRSFHLRHKHSKETIKLDLASGSLLIMSGATQHSWQHQIPKTKKAVLPRINLTFRTLQPS